MSDYMGREDCVVAFEPGPPPTPSPDAPATHKLAVMHRCHFHEQMTLREHGQHTIYLDAIEVDGVRYVKGWGNPTDRPWTPYEDFASSQPTPIVFRGFQDRK